MGEDLDNLKKEYKKIQEKYSLPEFDELNKEFMIEKIVESETDYLIREVRKHVAERLYSYLRFTETMLNPQNAHLFMFSIIKTMDEEDKKKVSDIYKKLAENEIKMVKIDIIFDEEKEAEFIKNSYNLWKEVSKEIFSIIEKAEKKLDDKFDAPNKGYFG